MNKHKVTQIVIAALLITAVLSMGAFSLAGAEETPPVHLIPCPNKVVDSSDEIEEALVTAVEDEVIQLEACTYYLSKVVVVRTAFHGTLRGAGKDLTVIKILPHHKIKAFDVGWPPSTDYYESDLFLFQVPLGQKGDITITDLSMIVTEYEPAANGQTDEEWYGNALTSFINVTANEANTTFERLRLTGSEGNGFGENVIYTIALWGIWDYADPTNTSSMKGNHTISDVDFTHGVLVYQPAQIGPGKIVVTHNTFSETGITGIAIFDCNNCQVEVTSNEVESNWNALTINQRNIFPSGGPSSFLVARNHFVAGQVEGTTAIQFVQDAGFPDEVPPSRSYLTITQNELQTGSDGIVLLDAVYWNLGVATLHAEVSENDIFLNESLWGAIQLLGGQGTRITDNHIYGKAWTGIYMGIFPEYGERVDDVLIKNNNLSNLEAEVAQVWLGGGTSNSMVIGGRYKPDVLDQGTNNILAGVNLLPGEMSAMGLSQASGLQGYASKLSALDTMKWMEMLRRHR